MAKRNKDGSWTIPESHLEEFRYGIDYKKLIQECLGSKLYNKPCLAPKKKAQREIQKEVIEDIEFEFEVVEEEDKPFWHRDIRTMFKDKPILEKTLSFLRNSLKQKY